MEWWKKIREFLSETRAEMKKVSFPTRDEVMSTTVIVIITSFVFAIFLWVADVVILRGYNWIIRVTTG
ncbi:MAG TPA: preprotein translocase subunit SecE [Thermoanaerobaculia bacterium]|nr:preprotein translocase subunit SecE [Thermoanaerobaculia bacterium]